MDLYGDLPPTSGGSSSDPPPVAAAGWARPNASLVPKRLNPSLPPGASKLLTSPVSSSLSHSHLAPGSATAQFKPRQATIKQTTSNSSSLTLSGPVVTTEVRKKINSDQNSNPLDNTHLNPNLSTTQKSSSGAVFDVENPYDPMKPNDYLAWCEERIEIKRLAKLDEENRRALLEQERLREQIARERSEAVEKGDIARLQAMSMGRGRGRGLNNLPAWMTQSDDVNLGSAAIDQQDRQGKGQGQSEADVGSRLMSRLGYKDGEGLGRDGQGITRPLEHRSAGNGTGVISLDPADLASARAKAAALSSGNPNPSSTPSSSSLPAKRKVGLFSNPSCVVLLKNMVGPGEVDEALARETKDECQKYGAVVKCLVYEVKPDQDKKAAPPEECVRTFVQFERQEGAVKAFRDLNGRFFAGRQITASFYDEDKFKRNELAPVAGEY